MKTRFSGGGVAPAMVRILLDPDPNGNQGGGGQQDPPAEDPIKALLAEKAAEARTLREQLDAFNKSKADAEAEAEKQRLKLVADKEGAEKALEEQRSAWEKKAAEAEAKAQQAATRHLSAEKNRAIALALAGHQWLEGGAETASTLLGPDFEARFTDTGDVVVVEKATGLPADKAIADRLAKPPFTHLRPAAQKGGAGAASQQPPAGGGASGGGSLGDQLRAAMKSKYGG